MVNCYYVDMCNFTDNDLINNSTISKNKWMNYYILCQYLAIGICIILTIIIYNSIDTQYDNTVNYKIIDINNNIYNFECYLRDADNCKCNNITYKEYKDFNTKIVLCEDYFVFLDDKLSDITVHKFLFLFFFIFPGYIVIYILWSLFMHFIFINFAKLLKMCGFYKYEVVNDNNLFTIDTPFDCDICSNNIDIEKNIKKFKCKCTINMCEECYRKLDKKVCPNCRREF